MPRYRFHKKDFSIHKDAVNAATLAKNSNLHESTSTEKTLTPASTGSINTIKGPSPTQIKQTMARSGTIRSVPSYEGSESSPESKHSNLSSSVHSNNSASTMEGSQYDKVQPSVKSKHESLPETPSRWSTGAARVVEPTPEKETPVASDNAEQTDGQWDSTIGKAGLGKTGRVINKLVSDNEALKRDIKIERLKSDEAKQAAKLVEDKMDRMVSDYESRLLEANVTKTLLARKERQVETLTATVELEKAKTREAQERERSWRDEMEKTRTESTIQVEEATSYAQLMEGRYNSISSHWRDQGNHVKGALSVMKTDIDSIVEERKKDDEKIQTLRDLCDQQDNNIKQLRQEKEEISRLFEEYKKAQEDGLRDIKENARRREEEQERILEESRAALAKLKWALNVKENVKGAQ